MPSRTTASYSNWTGRGRSLGSWPVHALIERARVASLTNSRLESHRDALRPAAARSPTSSPPDHEAVMRLGSHFVIRARRAHFYLVDFLANESELTGQTFTTPLTSPNPNLKVKFILMWSSPITPSLAIARGGGRFWTPLQFLT